MTNRYEASGSQSDFQPRSNEQVLRNLLGVTSREEMDDEALCEALAVTHVELILIHPFREGNGRLARLLADVMAAQVNRGLLDYTEWDRDKESYFAAIQQGLDRAYGPMIRLMSQALKD